jgi:uncharacterized protein (DUF1015 family)
MPQVAAFAALRPKPEYAAQVAAVPYDVVSTDEARVLAKNAVYSFLRVDKAEICLPEGTSPYSCAVYSKARENLDGLISQGILMRDERPCLYIYRLTAQGKAQTGLVCCAAVSDYERGAIKRHELTRPDKELDRIKHIQACCAHTGPILMACPAKPDRGDGFRLNPRAVDSANNKVCEASGQPFVLLDEWTRRFAPAYNFTAEDGVEHICWVVDDTEFIGKLISAFTAIPYFYIADGHHRSAAAAAVARMPVVSDGCGEFLSVIFPHDELTILDYNRVVRDLNGHTAETFLAALKVNFTVENGKNQLKPTGPGCFGLYIAGAWHTFAYKHALPDDPVDKLAASLLQNTVLSPLLGIDDPQTDTRIDFVGGARGMEELARRVDSGEMAAAFALCPPAMGELMAVADAGRIMPPKSTWFEPKLRSGLFIHEMKGRRTAYV